MKTTSIKQLGEPQNQTRNSFSDPVTFAQQKFWTKWWNIAHQKW